MDPLVVGKPTDGCQRPSQVEPWSGCSIAQDASEQDMPGLLGRDVLEHLQGGEIGPLQVVEDDHERTFGRHACDQRDRLLEQAELRPAVGEDGAAQHAVVARPEQPPQLADTGGGLHVGGLVAAQLGEYLGPRPQSRDAFVAQTTPPCHGGVPVAANLAELLQQRSLARTRLAFHHDQGRLGPCDAIQGLRQHLELLGPTDETAAAACLGD